MLLLFTSEGRDIILKRIEYITSAVVANGDFYSTPTQVETELKFRLT